MSGIEEHVHLNNTRSADGKLIMINQQPVMEYALDILTEIVRHKTITLMARGDSIPTAVAIANVLTENMLKGNSTIQNIEVDSDSPDGNALVSIIKITITKTN
ncbi:MAG TPA: DNA-binding protein [Candidatus Bathyarchaeia archaeon]|nr:DNA-binding protein [Candidatus Bathyarchaeia archaeon]